MSSDRWSRRSILGLAGLSLVGAAKGVPAAAQHAQGHGGHLGTVGRVTQASPDPSVFLRTWNFSDLAPAARKEFYRETPRPDGTMLREYEIHAEARSIEIAPGVFFPAWTYNGQVPGPTIRATEGDLVRVRFRNLSLHPHSIHFHGWHPSGMDGSLPSQAVPPGGEFVYEFIADPAGLHLYHCHVEPFKQHLHKGLYGVFIVDPKHPRAAADELVMVTNGFDTNGDDKNDFYAVNTVAHHYMHTPVDVPLRSLVRVYLVNLTEFDPINSFHLHGGFFDVFRTGTRPVPDAHTDIVQLCQGERAVLEMTFRYPGDYMFHAHQSGIAELGWMGLFRVPSA